MAYWFPDKSPVIWTSSFPILPLIFNILNVRKYGEIEFFFASLKVITIVGIVVLGLVIVAGGSNGVPLLATNNKGQPVSCALNQTDCLPAPGFECNPPIVCDMLSNSCLDWRQSAFKPEVTSGISGYFAGLWDCCTFAVLCYAGNELLGIICWETEAPRHTLPKAARRVSYRIILYYCFAIFVLGLTVSDNDPMLKHSQNYVSYIQEASLSWPNALGCQSSQISSTS